MKKIIFKILSLIFLSTIAVNAQAQGLNAKKLGQIRPDSIIWQPFAAFPPEVRLAVLIGNPMAAEGYTVRVKVPAGVILKPHRHPEDRVYTVISGVFYIGIGEKYDTTKLKAFGPGSVFTLPGNTPHFHWAKSGEYISQVSAIGPLGLEYVNPSDDPRKKK
jgi:quercetin dioxygenase-like cupin family protein